MTGRRMSPGRLRNGMLAAILLLAALTLAVGVDRSHRQPGSLANAPTTQQITALQASAALQKPVESAQRQLGPDISAGETGAVLAAETLLLSFDIFSVGLPMVAK